MDNEKAKRIRNTQTADHVEDSLRQKLLGLKFTLNERLETIQKLDETILENTNGRDIKKETSLRPQNWRLSLFSRAELLKAGLR